jgi:hypothetical protein
MNNLPFALRAAALAVVATTLSGCLAMGVAGAAVGVAGAAVGMTAKGVGAVVGAVTPGGKSKDDRLR